MITTTHDAHVSAPAAPMPRPRLAALTRLAALHWPRFALGAVLALAALLNVWALDRLGYANTYYAAAVKSMLQSWHNFFFVSFDPGGFVSIDKPPLGFWIETASAKLFGFSGLSLILPEALAGVLSVAVLYRLVGRVWGRGAGLLAALFLAVTPVSIVTARNNTIDSLLVLTVLLAAWAVARAVETGKLRWLLLCAVLVGLGFNIKMLEAYLVVPAFGLVYLVGARELAQAPRPPGPGRGGAARGVAVVGHGSRPDAGQCPPLRGLERDQLGAEPGVGLQRPAAPDRDALRPLRRHDTGRRRQRGRRERALQRWAGRFRLLGTTLGGQVSWLLILAVLGLALAALCVPWRRLDGRGRSLVLWGTWLLTADAFFSVAEFFHPYYTVMLAPAIAALAAIGVATLWRAYRARGWRGWLLPVVLLATAAVQAYILRDYSEWSHWLTPLVVGPCLVAAVVLAVARLRPHRMAWATLVAVGVAVASLLAAPTTWAAYSVVHQTNATIPTAGPSAQTSTGLSGFGGVGGPSNGQVGPGGSPPSSSGPFGGRASGNTSRNAPFQGGRAGGGPPGAPGGSGGNQVDTALIRYLEAHQGNTKYLVATASSKNASSIIIATGKPVMALGGFIGNDQILTTQQLTKLVANGTVHYFLIQSGGGPGGSGGNSALVQWVTTHGTTVPSSRYETSSTSATGGFGQATLYYVSSAAASK